VSAGHLTLDVPDVEARDMELHPGGSRRVAMLDHRLGVGHGLPQPSQVCPLPEPLQTRGTGVDGKRPSASFS
jgi:hypothetical protein